MKRTPLTRRTPLRSYSTAKGSQSGKSHVGKRGGVSRDRRRFQSFQRECQHQTCPQREGVELCQHHVVYEQHVRRAGGDTYDGRNALALCWSCHSSHHRRGRRLDLSALRDENFAFANDLLGAAAYDYLRRRYVGEDPRLDALLGAAL